MTTLDRQFCEFIDSLALPNFRGAEMLAGFRRTRGGVRNSTPPRELWPNIVPALVVAQEIRNQVGRLDITSSYRSQSYNVAVSGAHNSFHVQFRALDLVPALVSVLRLHIVAQSMRGKKFFNPHTKKQFIFAGGIGKYKSFVHIDDRARATDW
jgi:hypothetical protein